MARLLLLIGVWLGLWLAAGPLLADGTVTDLTQAALEEALAEGGLVLFDEEGTISITNTIRITNDVTLDATGLSVILSGGDLVRIFQVEPDVLLTVFGVTFSSGNSTNGGALYIKAGAAVELTDCIFRFNNADGKTGSDGTDGSDQSGVGGNGSNAGHGRQGMGGAIYNAGELTITTCLFLTNSATGGNGGDGGNGGAGTFQGGDGGAGGDGGSGLGGAIFNIGTSLSIVDSTFDGNLVVGGSGGFGGTNGAGPYLGRTGDGGLAASASGAGVYSLHDASIQNCTFSGNSGTAGNSGPGGTDSGSGNGSNGDRGGDSLGGGLFSAGSSELINCTFFANQVAGGTGGDGGPGVFVGGDGGNGGNGFGGNLYNTGMVMVVNCTFSSGRAAGGTNGAAGIGPFLGSNGSLGRGRGANLANAIGSLTLVNTLIATNTGGGNITNISGTFVDGGHNISSDASFNFSGTSKKSTNPQINALADNGGPTRTMSLKTNSPAIDSADDAAAPDTDQRGIDRPIGLHADIGAYESALAPLIQIQPQSRTQTNGGSVTFSVSALGEAPLSYFWKFNGTNISGGTSSSYTIVSVRLTNAGTYAVTVSNRFGTTESSNATLSVLAPPTITSQPTNQTAAVNGSASFYVVAAGTAPLTYQWRFNATNNIAGATASSYTVTNAQAINGGSYSVIVSNAVGSISSTGATLSVNGPPGISTQPSNQTVTVGSPATFTVAAVSPVPVTYQWRFYGTNLPGAVGASFSRSSALLEHAGPYDVVLANSFGTTESLVANLTVTLPALTGQVLEGTNGLAGVTITIATNLLLLTDANGNFGTNLPAGVYTVSPSKPGYRLEPATVSVTLPPSTNLVFSAALVSSITGRVLDGNNGLAGVTVSADTNTAITAADGTYTLLAPGPATYFVFATLSGYKLSAAQEVTVPPDASNINFFVSNRVFTISGRVLEGEQGLAGVTFQEFASLTTDSSGAFSISDLIPDTYTFTPRKIGTTYAFSPTRRTVTLTTQDVANVDFMAGSVISSVVQLTNGLTQLTVIGPLGTNRIEASTNLQDWESIFTNKAGPFLFADPASTNFPIRYYRAVQQR